MRPSVRARLRSLLLPPGLALVIAGVLIQGGVALVLSPQDNLLPTATPTQDRLAEPTLPAAPSQADHGSQVYWLSCMPCHGDRGQGLTDEFRQTYPPEDQYCWNSGCHGKRPYKDGFTLPMTIPALIGPGALQKFGTAAQLEGFIAVAMPFWKPGSLTEQQAWEVTAFLARQNGMWDGRQELNSSNASQVIVGTAALTPTPTPEPASGPNGTTPEVYIIPAVLVLILIVVLWRVFLRRKPTP